MSLLNAPSVAVCGLLDGQTMSPPTPGVALGYGRNVFRGYMRAPSSDSVTIPHTAVFVLTRGGRQPVHYKASESKDRLYASVTVTVRFTVNHFEDGEDFARSIWRALQRNIPSGYLECHCIASEPEYAGLDDTEHPIWTINLELVRVE